MEIKDKLKIGAYKQTSLKALPRVSPQLPDRAVTPEPAVSSESQKAAVALTNTDKLVEEIRSQASSLGGYVKSLGGIIDQGLKEDSEVRRTALAKEANQMLKAIEDKVVNIKISDSKVPADDPLRSEVEAKIGRTLDILFPEKEGKEANVNQISFSNKELIISVQTKILKTTQYLDSLRKAEVKDDPVTQSILLKAETAQLNAESSRTSLDQVNKAFDLANEANSEIRRDPKMAMFAVGVVRRDQVDVEG